MVPATVATAATGVAVTVGTTGLPPTDPIDPTLRLGAAEAIDAREATSAAAADVERALAVSRSRATAPSRAARRVTLTAAPEPVAKRFATADLNLWAGPSEDSRLVDEVVAGSRLTLVGSVMRGWAKVRVDGKTRFVHADYLAKHKPEEEEATAQDETGLSAATANVSLAPCPDGSSVERGLTADAVRLYRAVCAAFPALSRYGGWDNHGEHSSGRAIDFMISDPGLGRAVADWIRAHAAELDIYAVLYAQQIWTPVRASEGWRHVPDRGSATANHYDHVHASVN